MAENSEKDQLIKALYGVLVSPNERDRNDEAANMVDGLFAIARSLNRVALALEKLGTASLGKEVKDGIENN